MWRGSGCECGHLVIAPLPGKAKPTDSALVSFCPQLSQVTALQLRVCCGTSDMWYLIRHVLPLLDAGDGELG